jgi:hypothetical protein
MPDISITSDPCVFTEFVRHHPEGMFFYSPSYLRFLENTIGAIPQHLLAKENSQITGILPLFKKNGPWGVVYNSLPYYGSHGGVLARDEETSDALIEFYNDLISSPEVLASVWIENLIDQTNYSEKVKHNFTDYRIGQYTNIGFQTNHEAALMNTFHYKTRNMIRKGMKSSLSVKVANNEVSFLKSVHYENMNAIGGKAKSDNFFTFPDYFEADKDYKIWVAYSENEPVAAVLLFYYGNSVEYFTPVIKEEFREKQPLSLLIFEAMKDASEKGFKLWNWGGTWATQGGVYTFKKRWGTVDKNYNYFIQLNDKKILARQKEEFLSNYPDFFIVPFNLLETI